MTRTNWIIIGLAYVVGLLSTNLISYSTAGFTLKQWAIVSAVNIGLAAMSAIALRRIKVHVWLMALVVAFLAVIYFQMRMSQPQYNDVSYQITESDRQLVEIYGRVLTEPRLSDRQRLKFWFQAASINDGEALSGKLYATLPLLQGTGIYPGQQLNLKGFLYLPQPASSPQGFDFKEYLARQGIFAGIQGTEASFSQSEPKWGWWKLRRRIVRSQLQGLGSPRGQLVSSMVLGRKAVDLSGDIRDRFIQAGLAHVLAASGFHVSLLLGIILKLTTRIAAKPRLAIGVGTLMSYLGLTGIQASVLRACLMGCAVLLALTMDTKVKPLGSLLLTAVIILLFNPLLISDLGFQLSFLATFGLIVTLPKLQQQLDWLPVTIATLIAIPLAASVWVLPLLCYEFHTLATYSIVVNILCTPLITFISLGGMISAIVALILPAAGSAISSILYYPATCLMAIAEFCTSLPKSAWAIGQIPLGILLAIYGLFTLIWLNQWWQKRWWLGLMLPVLLLITTVIYNSAQVQITVLANRQSPIIVVQDRGKVILINSGSHNQTKYNLLPFLAQQGINQIDYGLAYDHRSNSTTAWSDIVQRVRIKSVFGSEADNLPQIKTAILGTLPKIVTKSARLTMDDDLGVINIQLADSNWLIISKPANKNALTQKIRQYIKQHDLVSQHLIIVSSDKIAKTWLELLQSPIAPSLDALTIIASSDNISPKIEQQLRQQQLEFYDPVTAGIIQWSTRKGFIQTQEKLN